MPLISSHHRRSTIDIAVLGGGNGSHAAAADLTLNGHAVRFWRRDKTAIESLANKGATLTLKDHTGSHQASLALASHDLGAVLDGAQLIVCPAPAFAQHDIALQMAPHLRDGQVIYLTPGTFGSYTMLRALRDAGCSADVAFVESGTLPYLTRLHGEGEIAVTTRATRLPSGVFPMRHHSHAMQIVAAAYPALEDAGDALSGALMNAGPIIHPPLIIMNAGPIQHFEHWDIHNEGTQPAVRAVTTQLDAERIAVREALGYQGPHFPLANHYDAEAEEWMYGNLAHEKLVDSGDWREDLVLTEHRYMREDITFGLAFLVSAAAYAGVEAPVASGLLAIGSAICDDDFRRSGRTLESIGIAGLSRQQMTQLLHDGL